MVIGVTGGVGSGKSVFAKELGSLGARVIDVDEIARELVDKRGDLQEALGRAFGPEIFDSTGRLRRRELGRIVFSDNTRLEILNQILQQASSRGITPNEVVTDVILGRSKVKEMMTPIEAGNLFVFGFSRHARFLVGGDLLIDGGMVLTY